MTIQVELQQNDAGCRTRFENARGQLGELARDGCSSEADPQGVVLGKWIDEFSLFLIDTERSRLRLRRPRTVV